MSSGGPRGVDQSAQRLQPNQSIRFQSRCQTTTLTISDRVSTLVDWPRTTTEISNRSFEILIKIVDGLSTKESSSEKPSSGSIGSKETLKEEGSHPNLQGSIRESDEEMNCWIKDHLLIGINPLTQYLTDLMSQLSQLLPSKINDRNGALRPVDLENVVEIEPVIRTVFVCRHDFEELGYLNHLPNLIEELNRTLIYVGLESLRIVIYQLPVGSEKILSEMLGIRQVSAIGTAEKVNA
ncbi:hypothetical protein BY996DRAFT_6409520 [Phakopsora pachyrhizi]|nr:hypothetical protein BY996DRAFT_6409520 [Phakopsora pachyrhizi]